MKYKLIVLSFLILLTGCSSDTLATGINNENFQEEVPLSSFNEQTYIESIEPIITAIDYIRLDSIFLDETNQEPVIITDRVKENILNVFNLFEPNHDTYALINFLDLHIKKLSPLEIDIILFKIINRIESDYEQLIPLVEDEQFLYLTLDYTTRITNTFIDNFEVSEAALNTYPDMYEYLDKIYNIINGGYQIRKFNNDYYIFPDYASVLVRYDEYFSTETADAVDILVRESRNVVSAGGILQVDNDGIAYKIDQIESFLKKYPNSVYYTQLRSMYVNYFITLVTNPDNIEVLSSRVTRYKHEVLNDFNEILRRYENTQMSKIILTLVDAIQANNDIYDETIINETIEKINSSY